MPRYRSVPLMGIIVWLTLSVMQGAAHAASYLDEAVQALQSSNVYVSVQVSSLDPSVKARLESQATTADVAIAVLPSAAQSEAGGNPSQFIAQVAKSTGHDTVVIAFGDDLEAGSRQLTPGLADQLADRAEANNDSVGDALLEFVSEVQTARTAPSPENTSSDGPGFSLILPVLILMLVVAVLGLLLFVRTVRSRPAPVQPTTWTPDQVQDLLSEIRQKSSGIRDPRLVAKLQEGERHTLQLFTRLQQASSGQIHEITARYVGLLKVVRNTLVQYQDIQDNPEYYEPATAELLSFGHQAVDQYTSGALRNVSEVARGSLTDFRVNVKILSASNPPTDPRL